MVTTSHHFVSYSTVEALKFVSQLHDTLESSTPSIYVWLDKRDLRTGIDWDTQIAAAIRDCASLLFVMSPDSTEDASICKLEWTLALKYKKPVVPLLLLPCDIPFRLQNRHYIDCRGDFNSVVDRVREHIYWLGTEEAELQRLKDQLIDAQRDLRRISDLSTVTRISDEISLLKEKILAQERLLKMPNQAATRTQIIIDAGIERERLSEKLTSNTRYINPSPGIVPDYFQGRFLETEILCNFIREQNKRLITIIGRGGIGKTALACRVLSSLEQGIFPNGLGKFNVVGIIYLNATGSYTISASNIFMDLCKLLPIEIADSLRALYQEPHISLDDKFLRLVENFDQKLVLLMLDNFENMLDSERNIKDKEIALVLDCFMTHPSHKIKIIVTSRVVPKSLKMLETPRQIEILLEEGLPSPYAENMLQAMDSRGSLGLRDSTLEKLSIIREKTRGYPRALEAFVAILAADRDTTLDEMISVAGNYLPENVVEALVGEAFNRLDEIFRKVIQALAIYGRPVTSAATDYLLQPYHFSIDSNPILNWLINAYFVRKEDGRYYLHPVDRDYALSLIPRGDRNSPNEPRDLKGNLSFTQIKLFKRAADYYKHIRKSYSDWNTVSDLASQFSEIELRCEAEDWIAAVQILLQIDRLFLFKWGAYHLILNYHEKIINNLPDSRNKQDAAGNLGSAYYCLGRINDAIAYQTVALRIAESRIDIAEEGVWRSNLGNRYVEIGQFKRGIDLLSQSLDSSVKIHDLWVEIYCLHSLAYVFGLTGKLAKALKFAEDSVRLAEAHDAYEHGKALYVFGELLLDKLNTDQAMDRFQESINIASEIKSPEILSHALTGKAKAYLINLNYEMAVKYAQQATEITYIPNRGYSYLLLGIALKELQHRSEAMQAFLNARMVSTELLKLTPQHVKAQFAYALATLGISSVTKDALKISENIEQAEFYVNKLRKITDSEGLQKRLQRLKLYFDRN